MSKEIDLYDNNFNEKKDLQKLKEIAIYYENLYYLNIEKLNQIRDIYFSEHSMLVDDISTINSKFFNYDVELFNLKSKIWNKVLNKSFIDKYLNSDQKDTVAKKLNIYLNNRRADINKETIEPNAENIYRYLSFIETSKSSLVNENLFRFIKDNSFRVLRKHNKPLEFTDYIVFDFIEKYRIGTGSYINKSNDFHKSLCAFFDLDFSKYDSIYTICKDAKLESIKRTDRNDKNYDRIIEDLKIRRKIKYDYLPDIKVQFFTNTLRLYFYGEAREKLNKEIIEVYKSQLIG